MPALINSYTGVSTGTLAQVPDTKTFITDEYLKRVERDPKLKTFAEAR